MPAAEGDGTKTAAAAKAAAGGGGEEGEVEAPWSLGDSAVFLSAALDGGGGGDESVSVEEARELLLKTGWRRSRGGGRYQTREKARARTDAAAAAAEFEGARGDEAVATTAVPSPSSLSATLSALHEHAGLAVAKGTGGAPPPPSYPPSPASSSLARAVRRCPSLLALSPNQVALAAAFLRSLGLDASDVAAACAREPRLLGFGVAESMAPVASFLRSGRVGMRAEDVARLAVSAPTVLGLSVARSLEPRVALLERALSCPPSSAPSPSSPSPSSSSGAGSPPTAATNPLLAKVLRSSPSLLHLSLGSGEETLAELERRLPDARVRSRAIAAAPSTLLVGAARVAATLDALARVASPGLNGDDGGGGEENGGGGGGEEAEERLRRLASDLVRRHPALLRHAFTGPEAVLMPAADWLARLLSVETGTETAAAEAAETAETAGTETAAGEAVETAETETAAARPAESESPPPLLLGLPPSSTPRGRALAAAAIRRCPALLGRSRSGLEGTASWLQERACAFILSSSAPSESDASDSSSSDAAFALGRENRGRTRSPKSANRTPLSLVAGVARRFPQAFGLARANLDAKLAFLTSEVGMSGGEAAGVAVSGMPQLLGLRLRSLRARAAFLLDGNDEVGIEEEEKEEAQGEGGEKGDGGGEGERSGSEEEAPRPAPAVAEEGGAEAKQKQRKPIRGRRSASEIARFAPCLATSLEKLVARHAAAGERRAAAPKKKTKKKTKRMPSLSSLLACTDAVLEGRLGLPAGSLEALKADRRVREAIERAEGAAVEKEEVEV